MVEQSGYGTSQEGDGGMKNLRGGQPRGGG